MEKLSDEELMVLVTQGNLDVMCHLFTRYHIKIFNYLFKLCKDREKSQDLTQEVFYKIIKRRATFQQIKFSPWIYTIAKNTFYDYYANSKQKEQLLEAIRHNTDVETRSETEHLERLNQLTWALSQLSIDDRELIVLSRYQGLKYQEIAHVTNSTTGAVKTKTHRALNKLRNHYFQNIKL